MITALFSGAFLYVDFFLLILLIILAIIFYFSFKNNKKEITKEREESSRRIYELAILKELAERAGYSLDVEEILQIITGSLKQLIDYTSVGYIVLTPEKIKINTHFEKSVSHSFLSEMKSRMIASLSALTDKSFDSSNFDEVVSGAILVDEMEEKIGSLFNIPLVIDGQVAGVLTIAHTKVGLYREEDMTILYKITNQASEQVSRLQEVVKIERGKLNAMVESMGDGVLMVDDEYRIIVANPAIKNIINYKGTNLNIFDFVDALGGKFDIRGRLEEAASKKTKYVSERTDINDTFFEIGVYPVLHNSPRGENQILGVVVVFHDVTRDIELERVREEYTSMIVHELRSPLDSIKKIMELFVSGKIDLNSNESKEYLNMTHQSSSSMLELVNDILDLSKLQAGKFEVNKEKANIKEVIDNRVIFYKISAETKGLSLQSMFSSNIPEFCDFDPQAIKQVLNNFISNSMKFTAKGGSVTVSAFACEKDGQLPSDLEIAKSPVYPQISDLKLNGKSLCVVVTDNGVGIPEGHLTDLFHTYKQVKLARTGNESKGTGLGLAIAKGITEAHGGLVGAVSKEGVGSSFFFTIPL